MKFFGLTVLGGVMLVSPLVNAAVITQDSTDVTVQEQSYSKIVDLNSSIAYTDVVIDLIADGDYSKNFADKEDITFNIDGIELFTWNATTPEIDYVANDVESDGVIKGSFSVSQNLWNSFSADNVLNISWQNGEFVNVFNSFGPNYVSYQIRGNVVSAVPEASVLGLMLTGLGFVGFMARRKLQAKNN